MRKNGMEYAGITAASLTTFNLPYKTRLKRQPASATPKNSRTIRSHLFKTYLKESLGANKNDCLTRFVQNDPFVAASLSTE